MLALMLRPCRWGLRLRLLAAMPVLRLMRLSAPLDGSLRKLA